MRRRFDVLAASHGAASLGLIALFAIAGITVLADPRDPSFAIGSALLAIAAIYFVAIAAIGKLARTGGFLERRFNFRAGSHGAAGFCIVGMFACSGVLTLKHLWQNPTSLGLALLAVSGSCAFGWMSSGQCNCSSEDDKESKLLD